MSDVQTMIRTEVVVNDRSYLLAQNQDVEDLKRRLETAAHDDGKFVNFTVVGNRVVSVLVSRVTTVVLSVQTVHFDPRDTGDDAMPYGGDFDY